MSLRLNVGNLSEVESGFEPIPEGVYELQVDKIESRTSQTGNPMLYLELIVVNHAEFTGKRLFDRISLVTQALWRLKEFCSAVGVEWDDTGVDVEPAQGQSLTARVVQELYTPAGKEPRRTNRIDEYLEK